MGGVYVGSTDRSWCVCTQINIQTQYAPNQQKSQQVLREVGPTGRVVHLAHSGGALLTYLVAKYHLKCVGIFILVVRVMMILHPKKY